MHSQLLTKHGLINYIAGSDYNFRHKMMGDRLKDEFEKGAAALPEKPQEIYSGTQIHGANIEYCDGSNGQEFLIGRHFDGTDGLITDQPGVALLIKYADCTPIVLYDPIRKVQASVHSGWRGTVQRIGQHALDKMVNDFGSNKADVIAFLGPSIDQDNYEVGPEVYDAFAGFEARDKFFKPRGSKYVLSMIDANYEVMREAGLESHQIEQSSVSTIESDELHSARGEKENYGLNAIITMIPTA